MFRLGNLITFLKDSWCARKGCVHMIMLNCNRWFWIYVFPWICCWCFCYISFFLLPSCLRRFMLSLISACNILWLIESLIENICVSHLLNQSENKNESKYYTNFLEELSNGLMVYVLSTDRCTQKPSFT